MSLFRKTKTNPKNCQEFVPFQSMSLLAPVLEKNIYPIGSKNKLLKKIMGELLHKVPRIKKVETEDESEVDFRSSLEGMSKEGSERPTFIFLRRLGAFLMSQCGVEVFSCM